jgi:hypothetical protein
MQFKVPQFIDIEDKLFGPLTFRQFIYLTGGAGMCFVAYKTMPLLLAILIIIPVAALSLALAFFQINNRPFIFYMQAAFSYLTGNKLYVWKQRLQKPEKEKIEEINKISVVPTVTQSKLKDIAWGLDMDQNDSQK